MFTTDKNKIQEHWLEEIYPRQNSAMFNNGFYCLFENSAKEEKLTKKTWIPVNDFLLNHTDTCEGLSTSYKVEGSNNNFFTCGECLASGDNGFIALSKKDTNELVWLIVLSGTNPFEKIIIHNSSIHVQSSNGTLAIVPIDRPDNLSIEWP
ncbi:hypothetical protein [Pseudomonas sp. RL_5y_Pfl2_70]|uniref:hypothetical protein n=1 Tax=Pseudomonas sp. RL_5y_Pfl2_70 TaxID=3088712 RepID=UPI0030D7DC36